MRLKVLLAGLLSLALVAAACGSDDSDDSADSAESTATADEAATDEGDTSGDETTTTSEADAEEDSGDDTGTDESDEAMVEVSIDESGRLVPAECPEGTNNEDPSLGVTETSVNIATLGIDYSALAEIGFAASGSDVREWFEAFVDDFNASGGICGRTLDYQGVSYDILANEGGQGCLEVTEDRTNAIVLVQAGTPEAVCVAGAGTVTYAQHDFTQSQVADVEDLMFIRNPQYEEQVKATVQWALDNNLLQGQKVGLWYGAVFPDQPQAVEDIAFPMLDEAGIDYIAARTDSLGPSDPEGAATLSAAATQFTSEDIDVLLNFSLNTNHTGMKAELEAQGGLPEVLISGPISANTANEIFQKAAAVEAISDGEQIVSFLYTPAEADKGDAAAPIASCMADLEEISGETIETNTFDEVSAANMCHQFDMLVAVLSLVGPEITQEKLVTAIESLPPHPMGSPYGSESFGEGHFSSPTLWGVLLYDGSTNTYTTTETFEVE